MEYNKLGNTDIKVSQICLGTMTYGEQNTERDAHEQLDYALNRGVNFIDTAEMYAIPAKPETYGLTEKYIGSWISSRKNRDDIILATKVVGPNPDLKHIRKGPKYNREHITDALNNSLKRLQTDYIDLYQLHFPERNTNYFKKLGYKHDSNENWKYNFKILLEILGEFVQEGKIRYIGVSNETPWGVMSFLKESELNNLPRIVSVQNPYNLLNRTFEIGLSEVAMREKCGLLAYSPLAFGWLSGKYYNNTAADNSRLRLFPVMARYNNTEAQKACRQYVELAKDNGISPSQMALSYINSRDFCTSNIIGATTMEQLKENIDSINLNINNDIIEEIDKIHTSQPNPAP